MEGPSVAHHRTESLQAPKADLPSHAPRQCQGSPPAPETPDEVLVGEVFGSPPRDPRQSGQTDGWRGWSQSLDPAPTAEAGRTTQVQPPPPTGPPSLDSQARHRRETPTGHRDPARPRPANTGQTGVGT